MASPVRPVPVKALRDIDKDYERMRMSTPPPSQIVTIEEYLSRCGGNKVIKKILIANNGIAAVKCIRSIRQWAYQTFGNERIISFIVMATPEDLKANAEYIRMADAFEEVPGGTNNNNYANVELIVDIAERVGVDAVWAGWGHASENPRLPDALMKANIEFIGPPAKPMRDLGDKIGATLIAQSANVSVVPWSGMGLIIDYEKEGIPDEIFRKSTVKSLEEAQHIIKKIGYPAMIKASEGGGGKGIRKVESEPELELAFRQVQGEVPGSPIFIMKMARNCHHLEVQVLGDKYGEAISLYSRDCSVQRRHQKIVEEGPVIAAPPHILDEMEKGAVRLAKAVGYVGAGTVEYLYSDEQGYFFLELNPRLQVEHPVTEQISGVNLPAAQLNIAMGIPLDRIPAIRRLYQLEHYGESKINFDIAKKKKPKGHVIAVRITAENPELGFKPTSGSIKELTFRSTPHVWGYFSVGSSGGLHEFADSQFGHLFAWGHEREDSRKAMVVALKELSIRGEIRTPVESLVTLLEKPEFIRCTFHTSWLDELIESKALAVPGNENERILHVICGAVWKAYAASKLRSEQFLSYLDRGQIPPNDLLQTADNFELIYLDTKFLMKVLQSGPHYFTIQLNNTTVEVEARSLVDGGLLVVVDGKSHVVYGQEGGTGLRLTVGSKTVSFSKEYDPSKLLSMSAGKLVRYLVPDGIHIQAGVPYAEIEVMKMYMPLLTGEAGQLRHAKPEGSMLAAGEIVAEMELDDPSSVKKASIYLEGLPKMEPPHPVTCKPHQQLKSYLAIIDTMLAGYYREDIAKIVNEMTTLLSITDLAVYEFRERMAALGGRIPPVVEDRLNQVVQSYKETLLRVGPVATFPSNVILDVINDYAGTLPASDARIFRETVASIYEVATVHDGRHYSRLRNLFSTILQSYAQIERLFEKKHKEDMILELRQIHKNNLQQVFQIFLARSETSQRKDVILRILDKVSDLNLIEEFVPTLHELASLSNKDCLDVSVKARELLMIYQLPSFKQRQVGVEGQLRKVLTAKSAEERIEVLNPLVAQQSALFDVLCAFICPPVLPTTNDAREVRKAALEVYTRRSYRNYNIMNMVLDDHVCGNILVCEWSFAAAEPQPLTDRPEGLRKHESLDNLQWEVRAAVTRSGLMSVFNNAEDLRKNFFEVLQRFKPSDITLEEEGINVINVFVGANPSGGQSSQTIVQAIKELVKQYKAELRALGVRRITLVVCIHGKFPKYYTYRERLDYDEDMILRHIEPAQAFYLELQRMCNYEIQYVPTLNRMIHLFFAKERGKEDSDPTRHKMFFVRATVRQGDGFVNDQARSIDNLIAQAEGVILEGIKSLEVAMSDSRYKDAKCNHIFFQILNEVQYEPEAVDKLLRTLGGKYGQRLWKLKVGELELVGKLRRGTTVTNLRFVIHNPTGYSFEVAGYVEVRDPSSGEFVLQPIGKAGSLGGMAVHHPYPLLDPIQRKRYIAQDNKTTYVHDFPTLFREAIKDRWISYSKDLSLAGLLEPRAPSSQQCLLVKELVLNEEGNLVAMDRPPGMNNIGMVAWRFTMRTPEAPEGRDVICIANDITYQIGSFGPKEDMLFYAASKLARKEGLPRIYISANSGARIGLAQEVMNAYKVEWEDPLNPQKGFKYLYVTEEDYQRLNKTGSIKAEKLENGNWKITDIIGIEEGLGVENLRGSGLIAGETSKAYTEIFTITLVTGRSVGIGAYLVRLGQRVVQNEAPIILTGAAAINKLLGKPVYTSNEQLGGPQIMFNNGVSHMDVNSDLRGVIAIVRWISYVPSAIDKPLPILYIGDPIDRPIDFMPTPTPYDPRLMLGGTLDESGRWVSGFFDRGSWVETLAAWAKTVICGRARLGGIPVGVIAVETRCVEHTIPADPANPESQETIVQKAGQVWFPDSAYKTAQAIQDFGKGEQLPIIIFANWRGFSGGMRDMFDEILKFGSYIVDALRVHTQPVLVYIPPYGELRGGAWVVVDPTINEKVMEMYCDELGTGGVLEATGTVEIKYRKRDILKTIRRLDSVTQALYAKLSEEGTSAEELAAIKKKIDAREAALLPTYLQVAVSFAELHDTPGRMKQKGVIRDVVKWKESRKFFYYRLKRRLLENDLVKQAQLACPGKEDSEYINLVHKFAGGDGLSDEEYIKVVESKKSEIPNLIQQLKSEWVAAEIRKLLNVDKNAVMNALKSVQEKQT